MTADGSKPAGLSLSARPISASLALTSSIDFEPKLRMSSRSCSERVMSSHGVDALALEAVVGAHREVEVLDRQRQVGSELLVDRRRSDVDALGLDVELTSQAEQLHQGGTGRRD